MNTPTISLFSITDCIIPCRLNMSNQVKEGGLPLHKTEFMSCHLKCTTTNWIVRQQNIHREFSNHSHSKILFPTVLPFTHSAFNEQLNTSACWSESITFLFCAWGDIGIQSSCKLFLIWTKINRFVNLHRCNQSLSGWKRLLVGKDDVRLISSSPVSNR